MQQRRHSFRQKEGLVFLLFFVVVQLFYWKTRQAGYVTDFTGLLERLEGATIRDTLHSLGYPGMEQVLRLVQFAFYKWFGAFGLHWYLLFTLVHTVNGWLLYRLLRLLLDRYAVRHRTEIAVVGALLFLLSPYQTEVLVWRVCLNYLLAGFFVLLSLNQALRYLENKASKHLYWSLVWMILGLFSFELALSGPLLVAGLALLVFLLPGGRTIQRAGLMLSLAHLALLPLYFLARKWVLGDWVGYYGAEVHLNFDLKIIIGNIYKYLTKLWGFLRYWEHPTKEPVFLSFEKGKVLLLLSSLAVVLYGLLFAFFKRISLKIKLGAAFLILFVLALGPAINLYSAYILHVENDRYGYMGALFCLPALVLLLSVLPRSLRYLSWAVLLGFSSYFLHQTTRWWQASDQVYRSLLEDYRWQDASEVYVLACPDNYEGILIFKDYSWKNLTVKDALEYLQGTPVSGEIYQVGQFNMTAPDNSVAIQQDSTGLIRVQFEQAGNWWWRGGIGALDYEKPNFKFTKEGLDYWLERKAVAPDAVYIYSDGGQWREFILIE